VGVQYARHPPLAANHRVCTIITLTCAVLSTCPNHHRSVASTARVPSLAAHTSTTTATSRQKQWLRTGGRQSSVKRGLVDSSSATPTRVSLTTSGAASHKAMNPQARTIPHHLFINMNICLSLVTSPTRQAHISQVKFAVCAHRCERSLLSASIRFYALVHSTLMMTHMCRANVTH
jgi:hypothetical protein